MLFTVCSFLYELGSAPLTEEGPRGCYDDFRTSTNEITEYHAIAAPRLRQLSSMKPLTVDLRIFHAVENIHEQRHVFPAVARSAEWHAVVISAGAATGLNRQRLPHRSLISSQAHRDAGQRLR
jgi:hypothetical protein